MSIGLLHKSETWNNFRLMVFPENKKKTWRVSYWLSLMFMWLSVSGIRFRFESKVNVSCMNTFWHHSVVVQTIGHASVSFYSAALLDMVCTMHRPCLWMQFWWFEIERRTRAKFVFVDCCAHVCQTTSAFQSTFSLVCRKDGQKGKLFTC